MKAKKTLNTKNRTPARGLARYAREYFDTALAADEALEDRKRYRIRPPPAVMFLVSHSIELGLKAYLRHNGATLCDLKKVGHDLEKAWAQSKAKGIEQHVTLTASDVELLSVLNRLHKSFELRYIVTGYKQYPVFGPLCDLADKLLNGICPLVGYPNSRSIYTIHRTT